MANEEDAVGYKRPPKSGQFKPGKSGNPRGRRKGSTNFKTDLAAEMREHITLRDKNGRARKVTKQRALIKLLFSSALQNEKSAITTLLTCLRYFGTDHEASVAETTDLEDLDMIRDYVERAEARRKHDNTPACPNTPTRKGKN